MHPIHSAFDRIRRIRAQIFTFLLAPGMYKIGKKTRIIPPLRFANLSLVELGNRVVIQSDCWINILTFPCDQGAPKLVIGDYTGIGMNCSFAVAESVRVGSHVLFGRNIYVSDHSHEYCDVSIPMTHQGIRKIVPVTIGDESWLGNNVVVLPGGIIGKHCVIGANSVVNSTIPDFSVAAGAPAKVIRKYSPDSAQWEPVTLHE